jgi:hypothetical protein
MAFIFILACFIFCILGLRTKSNSLSLSEISNTTLDIVSMNLCTITIQATTIQVFQADFATKTHCTGFLLNSN